MTPFKPKMTPGDARRDHARMLRFLALNAALGMALGLAVAAAGDAFAMASPAMTHAMFRASPEGMTWSMRRAVATGVSIPTSAASKPSPITNATSRKSLPIASVMRSRTERALRGNVRWKVKAKGARRCAKTPCSASRA